MTRKRKRPPAKGEALRLLVNVARRKPPFDQPANMQVDRYKIGKTAQQPANMQFVEPKRDRFLAKSGNQPADLQVVSERLNKRAEQHVLLQVVGKTERKAAKRTAGKKRFKSP